jgi:hypothetical protein
MTMPAIQMPSFNLPATTTNVVIERPNTLDLYTRQRNDILSGGNMFDVTVNTLHKYSSYTGADGLDAIDGFFYKGADIASSRDDVFITPVLAPSATPAPAKDPPVVPRTAKPEDSYIEKEKRRIKNQSDGKQYNRPDHFAIGTVYLEIPPTQISVSDEAHNFRFGSLRSPGETVISSGRSTTRVDLEIIFSGLDNINNALRPLLAQLKTTPFLPIENEYLRKILNPFDTKLVDINQMHSKKAQLLEMQKRAKILDDLIATSAQAEIKQTEIHSTIKNMADKNWITKDFQVELITYMQTPDNMPPPEKRTKGDYYIDPLGNEKFSWRKFIARNMDVKAPRSPDMLELTRNLNEIDAVSEEIIALKQKSQDLGIRDAEEKFTDKQLMCVLSQIAVSTMPGFPEALACRLSLYVFNYEPFSLDCAFIYGYNKDYATPDITKCDLFIDWYTRRWLSDNNDPKRPGLGMYGGDPSTEFIYITKITPTDNENVTDDSIQTKSIQINDGMYVTGITVSLKNIIQFLPILSSKNPTCQYMGSINGDVQFAIEAVDEDRVVELSQMVDRIRSLSRTNNRVTRNSFMRIKNNFLDFMAMPFFTIDNYSIDTVPGNPGMQSISISFIEYRPGQEELQELKRDGVTNQDELVHAAKWMLTKARNFITSGGPAGANSRYDREIYDQVMDPETGWFRKNNSVVTQFMGYADDTIKKDQMIIESKLSVDDSLGKMPIINERRKYIKNYDALLWNNIYEMYATRFALSIDNISVPTDLFKSVVSFESDVDLMSRVIVRTKRDELVNRILHVSSNPELNNELNRNRKKEDLDAGKTYCYPDLDLPRYSDIPNGLRLINTNLESGKQGSGSDNAKPAQSNFAMVDPDFFFYKGSLWGNLDNSNDMNNAVDAGIKTYNSLAHSNKNFRRKGALDEGVMEKLIKSIRRGMVNDGAALEDGAIEYLASEDEKRDSLDGKLVTVSEVISGNEIKVTDGVRDYQVVVTGYTPTATNQNAKTALSSYVSGKTVRVDLGEKFMSNGKYLGRVQVAKGSSYQNVNDLMIRRKSELHLAQDPKADDPLDDYNNRLFFDSHDTYVMTWIDKILRATYAIGGIVKPVLTAGALANLGLTALTAKKDEAEEKVNDALGILQIAAGVNQVAFPENILTNNIKSLPGGDGQSAPTLNNGINKFDRESEGNIRLIADRIRQSQKDNTLRMSRAFPTFKVYFIEEDMPDWGRLDDKYAYQAVASIDITKSRTEAADVAVVKFFNTLGTLDKSYFGLHDADGKRVDLAPQEAIESKKQETRGEQALEQFILKPGTVIKIKMGYYSDPDLLDTVFTGMIAEVSGGDMIEVVAQGFGVELLIPVQEPSYKQHAASAFKVLDKIIKNPAINHFGKTKWFPESSATEKVFFRRQVSNPDKPGELMGASWWRNIGGFRHILGVRDDTRDNNIWVPENSWLYNMSHGGTQTLITKDKSIWDMFRDMMRRMPGYITTVLPFDNRATIYFGPADFLYWATDDVKDEKAAWKNQYKQSINKPDEEKLQEMIDSGEITYVTPKELDTMFSKLGKHIEKISATTNNGDTKYQERVANYLLALGRQTPDDTNSSKNISTAEAVAFAKLSAQAELTGNDLDGELKKAYDLTAAMIESNNNVLLSVGGALGGSLMIKYIGRDGAYVRKDGKIVSESDAVKWYNDTREYTYKTSDPSRKLVRQYHYKDSFHHIVSNSIIATSNYLHNRVTVEFGNEKRSILDDTNEEEVKAIAADKSIPTGFQKVSAQVDDDIWPERVKEKVVQEKNANNVIVAWNYALGNLWEEMRKMYSGHLVVLGDAAIRPYDIIMMSDYFTEMFGPVEVEQVTHHFSPETGFVTTIVPNLVCHVNNSLQKGSLVVAGAYMDATTKYVERVRSSFGLGGLLGPPGAWLGNRAANLAFWMNKYSTGQREPMSFSPLVYVGRPFVAGVEGMRKTSLYEAVSGNLVKFVINRSRIQETIGEIISNAQKLTNR